MRSLAVALCLCVLLVAGKAQKSKEPANTTLQSLALSEYTDGLPTVGPLPLAFAPAGNAASALVRSGGPMRIAPSVMAARLQHKVEPALLLNTLSAAARGPVVLEVRISKAGRVHEMRGLQGAPELMAAAQRAVRQWTYEPYLLEGRPIEVVTRIVVHFDGGR